MLTNQHHLPLLLGHFVLAMTLLLSPAIQAKAPKQCIESLNRSTPCPNLAYRALAASDDPEAGSGLTCICLVDFQQLKKVQTSPARERLRQIELQRLSNHYGITKQQFIELLR